MSFIHYYNQHLVDNNVSTREELDVDEEELTRLNVARLNKKVLKIW